MPPSEEKTAAHGVRAVHTFVQPSVEQLNEIARLVDSGKVRPIIEKVFPLAEARVSWESNSTGHTRGKIVLRAV